MARDPDAITLREVIETIDGPITVNRCALDANSCEFSTTCPICEVFVEARDVLVEKLEEFTFADVSARALEIEKGNGA